MFGSLYAARVVRLPSVPISLSFSSPFVWIVVYWPHCVFFLVFLRSRYRERGASLIPRRFWISLNGQTVHILNSSWKCSIFCYRPAVRTVLGMHACWLLRTNSCCCYCCEYLFTQRCEQSAGVSAYVHQQVSVRIFLEFFFSVFFIMLNGHSLCIEPKSAAAETASPSLTMASCKNERYSKNERANKQKKISDSDLDMDYFRQPPRELDIHTNIHIAVLCMPHNNTVLY